MYGDGHVEELAEAVGPGELLFITYDFGDGDIMIKSSFVGLL